MGRAPHNSAGNTHIIIAHDYDTAPPGSNTTDPPGCAAPYQVELEAGGALIYALQDVDEVVRKAR